MESTVVANILEALHSDSLRPLAPHPAVQEAFAVLVGLRRLARQYLMDDRDWDEYYLGLVIALLGSLKYPELEPSALRLALIGAATARSLIGKPVTETDWLVCTRKWQLRL